MNACRVSVGKSEGRGSLGRRRRRWEDNITIGLIEIKWTGLIWLRIGSSGWLL
jgi:hypothetical protein